MVRPLVIFMHGAVRDIPPGWPAPLPERADSIDHLGDGVREVTPLLGGVPQGLLGAARLHGRPVTGRGP